MAKKVEKIESIESKCAVIDRKEEHMSKWSYRFDGGSIRGSLQLILNAVDLARYIAEYLIKEVYSWNIGHLRDLLSMSRSRHDNRCR